MGFDMYAYGHEDYATAEREGWYFRLNIGGMGRAIDELVQLGVMEVAPCPKFPSADAFGLSDWPEATWDDRRQAWIEDVRVEGEWVTAEVVPGGDALRFLEAVQAVTDAQRSGDCHGIPTYKVGTNDGWLVTPGEISSGIAWANHHEPAGWRQELTVYVREFVDWMERTADVGGFRVF